MKIPHLRPYELPSSHRKNSSLCCLNMPPELLRIPNWSPASPAQSILVPHFFRPLSCNGTARDSRRRRIHPTRSLIQQQHGLIHPHPRWLSNRLNSCCNIVSRISIKISISRIICHIYTGLAMIFLSVDSSGLLEFPPKRWCDMSVPHWFAASPRRCLPIMLRGFPPPRRVVFRLIEQDTETSHGRVEFTKEWINYKLRNITTTYIKVYTLMRRIKPQNVMYRSTHPGHNHIQYKIMQWHDRRRPHASQWPKPAYQITSMVSFKTGNLWLRLAMLCIREVVRHAQDWTPEERRGFPQQLWKYLKSPQIVHKIYKENVWIAIPTKS